MTAMLWGPLTRLGLAVAVAIAVLDQASKLWLLFAYKLGDRGIVTLTPFLDIVLAWNTGISFSLFAESGDAGPVDPAGPDDRGDRAAVGLARAGSSRR